MPRPTGGFLAHRALSVVLAVAAGMLTGLGLYDRLPDPGQGEQQRPGGNARRECRVAGHSRGASHQVM
jgi:hypothetical protein